MEEHWVKWNDTVRQESVLQGESTHFLKDLFKKWDEADEQENSKKKMTIKWHNDWLKRMKSLKRE
jgi:hypothetical protein